MDDMLAMSRYNRLQDEQLQRIRRWRLWHKLTGSPKAAANINHAQRYIDRVERDVQKMIEEAQMRNAKKRAH